MSHRRPDDHWARQVDKFYIKEARGAARGLLRVLLPVPPPISSSEVGRAPPLRVVRFERARCSRLPFLLDWRRRRGRSWWSSSASFSSRACAGRSGSCPRSSTATGGRRSRRSSPCSSSSCALRRQPPGRGSSSGGTRSRLGRRGRGRSWAAAMLLAAGRAPAAAALAAAPSPTPTRRRATAASAGLPACLTGPGARREGRPRAPSDGKRLLLFPSPEAHKSGQPPPQAVGARWPDAGRRVVPHRRRGGPADGRRGARPCKRDTGAGSPVKTLSLSACGREGVPRLPVF